MKLRFEKNEDLGCLVLPVYKGATLWEGFEWVFKVWNLNPKSNYASHLQYYCNSLVGKVMERAQILKILSETRRRIEGKDGAAAILGIHPSTLRTRLHNHGILRPEIKEPD